MLLGQTVSVKATAPTIPPYWTSCISLTANQTAIAHETPRHRGPGSRFKENGGVSPGLIACLPNRTVHTHKATKPAEPPEPWSLSTRPKRRCWPLESTTDRCLEAPLPAFSAAPECPAHSRPHGLEGIPVQFHAVAGPIRSRDGSLVDFHGMQKVGFQSESMGFQIRCVGNGRQKMDV